MIIEAMKGITFGCDPELFVVDSDGEYVSAEGLIPGTKEDPYPVPDGAVQVDGMAAEFNIDPVTTYEEFHRKIDSVMGTLQKMLPTGYSLVATPSVEFSEKVWDETPDKAKILGCSADFNAWSGDVNPPPECLEKPTLRCAGGHLHFGWTDDADMSDIQHVMACRDLVKQLDWYLGLWSLRLDKDTERRKLYGKAGSMRFKPYGVEYRALSNFWLANTRRRKEVWNRMNQAIWDLRNGELSKQFFHFNDTVIQSINESHRIFALEKVFKFPVMSLSKN